MFTSPRFVLLLGLATVLTSWSAVRSSADRIDVTLHAVRGQTTPFSTPVMTVGGRIAIDDKGMIYGGTPGPSSYLQKMTSDGRVVWQHFHNVPGFQAVVIDDQYVYSCGSGYYGYRQVQRWRRDSGRAADGWQHQWQKEEESNGVRSMGMPVALAVDSQYLFVLDRKGDELRRLNKATGAEAPFPNRVMVVQPRDLARCADGRLLVLTAETVLELSREGKPLRTPLVGELHNAAAITFDPVTSGFFVAEGGAKKELINKVRQFDKEGRPTGWELGRGGNFQGPWSADAFAFSESEAGLAVGPDGSLWVQPGWGHRLGKALALLSQFKRDRSYDHSIIAVNGFEKVALGGDLGVNLWGHVQFGPDGGIIWTSGLIFSGSEDGYPSTHEHWPTTPIRAGDRLFVQVDPDGSVYELDARTGQKIAPAKGSYRTPASAAMTGLADRLLLVPPKTRQVMTAPLTLDQPPAPVVTLAGEGAIRAIAADGDVLLAAEGGEVVAYRLPGGEVAWRQPMHAQGSLTAAGGLTLVGAGGDGQTSGVQIYDTRTGAALKTFGDQALGSLPPFSVRSAISAAVHNGDVYLAVKTPGMVRVYRLVRRTTDQDIPLNTPQEPQPEPDATKENRKP